MPRRIALLIGLAFALACSPAPAPALELVGVRELGPTAEAPNIRGRDGGYGGLAFGRSVWLFGDTTLLEPDTRGSGWRNGTWSWTGDLDASDGLAPFMAPLDAWQGPAELFPYTAEEQAYNELHATWNPDCAAPCGARVMLWPAALVDDPERARTLVFYGKWSGEPGEWNFWALGSSVAIWTDFDSPPERLVVDASAAEPTLLWQSDEPLFGAAALLDGGWLYAFACEGGFDKPCLLARVEPERVLERSAWRYYDGHGYASELADAEPVFEGHTILSVHHNAHLDRFLAVYSEPLGTGVMLRTAESLEGPWSRATKAFDAEPSHDDAAPYSALAHPELAREGGRFEYVTYFRSPGAWDGEIRLVELELARP